MCSSSDRGEFYLFLMTFPLDFDLLMIGVCTFIKKKRQKKRKKDKNKKTKQNEKKKKKKVQRYACVSYLTPSIFFLLLGSSVGI